MAVSILLTFILPLGLLAGTNADASTEASATATEEGAGGGGVDRSLA